MSTTWEERQAEKRERLAERAVKVRAEGEARYAKGHDALAAIPLGQPILVDHYSANRDRNYRDRAFANIGKGLDALAKADRLEKRAAAPAPGIASDDENATTKLAAKIAKLETQRESWKAANKLIRTMTKNEASDEMIVAALVDTGWGYDDAFKLVHPQFHAKPGIPAYALTNLGATIREAKRRLAEIETVQAAPTVEVDTDRFTMTEDDGRFILTFASSDRLPADEYKLVRSHGFVWAPSRKAFVRKITANAQGAAARLVAALNTDTEGMS